MKTLMVKCLEIRNWKLPAGRRSAGIRHLILLFALTTLSLPTANGQPPTVTYRLLYTIETPARNFAVDNLQNVYLLTTENELVKYTPDGIEQYRYPNKTLGEIGAIDATNPFQILLFFPDYQNMLLLDRTLGTTGQFNIFRLGLFEVTAVAMASDNQLWVYDDVSFRLKKVNENGEVSVESTDLSLSIGRSIHPRFMMEKNQTVYMSDPEEGVLVFDVFGQYIKTIEIKGITDFQVFGEQLYFLKKNELKSFHLEALLGKTVALPAEVREPKKVRLGADRLYVLDKDGLKVFGY
jgi:hypothetical protein